MLKVTYDLQLSMIDVKVANAITGTSSMSCSICDCKPTQMNDLRAAQKRPLTPEACQLGLSTTHAWIRCFEYILRAWYRMEVKTWSVRGAMKKEVRSRKAKIQRQFRERAGLVVDQPRAGGTGTSNDGNTARRAFGDPKTFSEITGVDEEVIHPTASRLMTP